MKVTKKFTFDQLPQDLRLALRRFAETQMDGHGYFALDEVTIEGHCKTPEEGEHPHDDATGHIGPDATGC